MKYIKGNITDRGFGQKKHFIHWDEKNIGFSTTSENDINTSDNDEN